MRDGGAFARDTTVAVAKSRAEIEELLRRYGAHAYASGWDANRATIGFTISGRMVQLQVVVPPLEEFLNTGKRKRAPAQARAAHEQENRRRWRALALVIKAKLEAVASGISTVEQEFMAHVVLPNGRTVGEWLAPQLDQAYSNGRMPPMLPPPVTATATEKPRRG